MQIDIRTYLNPKINHHCLLLFENKHFTECAHTAMKQVEINLNKKVGINRFAFAVTTINKMFSSGKGVLLRVPLGKNQQENAKLLFKGAFQYYRNYTAHNQEHIDDKIALRVMVLASELLDLLDCCTLDLEELGGVDEIINIFQIQNKNRLNQLLTFIDGQYIIEDISDGLFEDLASNGFSYEQYEKLFELNLVFCEESHNQEKGSNCGLSHPEYFTYFKFKLTEMGHELLQKTAIKV